MKVSPKRRRLLAAGFLGGVVSGIALAVMDRYVNRTRK